jgi:hypothetical protein
MNAAIAQYAPGYYAPGYYAPGYYARGYYARGYAPGYYAPGYYAPGYMWREWRLYQEWRTNIVQDWQLRENYEKQRTLNNTIGSGFIGNPNAVGGECAKGFSEETCRRRGQTHNPPRQD